ncbi:carbohydrate porin [Klebsiella pneumoniae subsp. pneumoniae]|nr:carbohydrate porin [Klebsiella pneumoniae subsp. pneumoniae]
MTGIYNFDGFYGLTGGYSRLALQYGKGLAAGDSLGKNWLGLGQSGKHPVLASGAG